MDRVVRFLRRWWGAEFTVDLPLGAIVTVDCHERGGAYCVEVAGVRHEYVARWYDTRRSIARKLARVMRGSLKSGP